MKEKSILSQLPWTPVVTALITLAGVWLSVPSLDSSRPAFVNTPVNSPIGDQVTNARLWEDPLLAVEKDRSQSRIHLPGYLKESLKYKLNRLSGSKRSVMVMGVMLPSGPYSEDLETRLRIREAIVYGLSRNQYIPTDSNHLGFVSFSTTDWPQILPIDSPGPRSKASAPRSNTVASLADGNQIPGAANDATSNPGPLASEDDSSVAVHFPYEWWQFQGLNFSNNQVTSTQDPCWVLVIWLPEGAFSDRPMRRLAGFFDTVFVEKIKNVNYSVLGPYSSSTLAALILDSQQASNARDKGLGWLKNLEVSTATATAPWAALDAGRDIAGFLTGQDKILSLKSFSRRVQDDEQVTVALIQELKRRGINPSVDPIVLISERDTLYGRALPLAFEKNALDKPDYAELVKKATVDAGGEETRQFLRFSYLRGLDGHLPTDDQKISLYKDSATGATGKPDALNLRSITTTFERPEGRDQSDYLRRISDQLTIRDDQLRHSDPLGRGIRAVGVLGSDLYDKLMILKALRPNLPEAVFFTSDLDARYTYATELDETRGLIVAAPFGLSLARAYQGDIPPFRDSYQVSVFYTTLQLLKMDGVDPNPAKLQEADGNSVEDAAHEGASVVQIFQIGNTKAVDISPAKASEHPKREEVSRSVPLFSILLASIIVTLFFMLLRPQVKRFSALESPFMRHVLAGASIFTVSSLVVGFFWAFSTNRDDPRVLSQGVSIWATEFLRLCVILLSGYLVFAGWRILVENEHLIKERLLLPLEAGKRASKVSFFESLRPSLLVYDNVSELWLEYLWWGRPEARKRRVLVYTLVFCGIVLLLFFALGFPISPARGEVDRLLDWILFTASLIAVTVQSMFAGDSSLLCWRFIRGLSRPSMTWEEGVVNSAKRSHPTADSGVVYLLLTMRLVALRSEGVMKLIWNPSLCIAVLVFARNTYFAEWAWTPSLVVIISLGLSLPLLCHMLLVAEAKRLKDFSNKELTAKIQHLDDDAAKNLIWAQTELRAVRGGALSRIGGVPVLVATLIPLLAAIAEILGKSR